MTCASPTKRNLVMVEASQQGDWMVKIERINSRRISYGDQKLLVLLPTNPYVWLEELSIIYLSSYLSFIT